MLGHVLVANMTNNVVFLEVLSLKDMMNGESGRRIEPQHLRETILRAAIPLIPGWDAVTTAQIARAAGIDEVTFRILAGAFIGLYSGGQQNPQPEPSQLSAEQLVDLFLHGTMTATN
jgi:hypothetical protein